MTTPSSSGNSKILVRILASTFTILVAVIGTMYAKIASDLDIAKTLAAKHETEIPYIKDTSTRIEKKLDTLTETMNEFLIQRYGYIPKEPNTN